MKHYILIRTQDDDIEIIKQSVHIDELQTLMKTDYENHIPFDWQNNCSDFSICDDNHARLYVQENKIIYWSIQEIQTPVFSQFTDVPAAINFIDACDDYVKDQIYRHLWKNHVIDDVESHMEDMDVTLTKDEIDLAAHRYAYDGDYDCNLSYWDNIENRINDILEERNS